MQSLSPPRPAKLGPPKLAADALPRPRLVTALQEHLDRKLQLLVAPAGFGKTTLLTQFIHEADLATCWVTLDTGDRDIASFVESVVTAVRRLWPAFGVSTLALVHGVADIEGHAAALARSLAAEIEDGIDTLAVLVLDDYHEVGDSKAINSLVDELLRVLPDNLRVVLSGRTLPDLTVSRLIVQGDLFGLGEADLRFTTGELLTLLHRRGRPVTAVQADLAEGAEGWIAGFLLSVPELWDGLVGGLIGGRGEGPLYDYLAAEAFDRQPEYVQRFLLASSVPETPDLGLCTALLGPGPWTSVLDQAERAGLFITRMREERGPFRYHQLFRRFLQTRLRRERPDEYRRLHGLVARTLVERGEVLAALPHVGEAGAEDEAAALVAAAVPDLERTSRWRALVDAVTGLPPESAAAHPEMLLAAARAALVTRDLLRAQTLCQTAREAGERAGVPEIQARALAALGTVRRLQGRTVEALDVLHRALDLAPDDQHLRASVRRDIGQCMGVRGDFTGAVGHLQDALAHFDAAGQAYEAARTEFPLGMALARAGRMVEAIARYESALGRVRGLGGPAMEAEILNNLGYAYAYRGEYERARAVLQEALGQARQQGRPVTEAAVMHSLGEVLLAAGEVGAALDICEQGLRIAEEAGELWVVTDIRNALALGRGFAGEYARAEEHAHHAIALAQRQSSPYLDALCSLTLGAIRSRLGRPDALATLETAHTTLTGLGAKRELMRSHLWLAQAHQAAGADAVAFNHLRAGLALAHELGNTGSLDLHARWDPSLFRQAVAAGIEPALLTAVLERATVRLAPQEPVLPPDLPALEAFGFGAGVLRVGDTHDADWAWDKARELFFLLLQGGPRRPEGIMALLWPDSAPAKAKSSLHTAVYRLRRAVHPRAILLRGGTYRVNEELVTHYDVREFERLVRAGLDATGVEAATLLQQAADLHGAPFLADVESEWCIEEREGLERRYRLALQHLIEAHDATGNPRASILAAERLLALDPLREDIHARIIRTYLRLGERAAAYSHFRRCVTTLDDELGVAPGRELQELAKRMGV